MHKGKGPMRGQRVETHKKMIKKKKAAKKMKKKH